MPALIYRVLTVLLLLLGAIPAAAQPNEADVKAAFIFNFAQFVEWPSNLVETNAPFVIAVAGAPKIHDALLQLTRGERVRGRPIEVRPVRTPAQAAQVQIFVCGSSEAARWPEFQQQLQFRPVLTVSDADGFARRGGMLEFFRTENKVRFRANPAQAKAANLVLSAKLLRLAEIVETAPD